MNPLLSILIPTKNRYEYIKEIVAILNKIKSDDIEFVIQDNSEEGKEHDSFVDYIAELNDVRIKYFYFSGHLSINENADRTVLNSSGKYVCFIGDDDCVTSQIVDAVKWMEKESIEVLTFYCPSYIWTDVEYKYLSKKHTGVLSFRKPTGKVFVKDPSKELSRLLDVGGQKLQEMPQLYHGITTREILNKIFDVTGSFFPGSVPDMDVAVCLSLYTKKYYKIDLPIVISGTAKKSAGGLGASKMHKGEISKITTLPKDTAETWNSNVPFYWTGPTIYADSIHKCLTRTGNNNMLERFNYNFLYATLFVFHSDYNEKTIKTMRLNPKSSLFRIIYFLIFLFLKRSFYFIKNRVPDFFKSNKVKVKLSTISEATSYLEDLINKIDLPWYKIL